MTPENRNSAIAAVLILGFFGIGWIVMPKIMLAAGDVSPVLGGLVAVAFVMAFFAIFWLRARSRRK